MANEMDRLPWPAWSRWALLAVVVTALATIAATINDIW
jgi:hypothetical protein